MVKAGGPQDCQRQCWERFPECKGIEYSLDRCELWTRPEGIFMTKTLPGDWVKLKLYTLKLGL